MLKINMFDLSDEEIISIAYKFDFDITEKPHHDGWITTIKNDKQKSFTFNETILKEIIVIINEYQSDTYYI